MVMDGLNPDNSRPKSNINHKKLLSFHLRSLRLLNKSVDDIL